MKQLFKLLEEVNISLSSVKRINLNECGEIWTILTDSSIVYNLESLTCLPNLSITDHIIDYVYDSYLFRISKSIFLKLYKKYVYLLINELPGNKKFISSDILCRELIPSEHIILSRNFISFVIHRQKKLRLVLPNIENFLLYDQSYYYIDIDSFIIPKDTYLLSTWIDVYNGIVIYNRKTNKLKHYHKLLTCTYNRPFKFIEVNSC